MFKKNTMELKFSGILGILIFLYIWVFTLISFWKYNNFLYNGIDLAIFNQVIFNTTEGRWFDFSIHPHSYLGDHFAPFILFLSFFYFWGKSPLTLLFLQSVIIGFSAWPIYLITKQIFQNHKKRELISFSVAALFLLNPFIENANLFEFHLLPFALFFLLWAFYFYLKNNFWVYGLFLFLALLVREDVSLVVFMFSFLPFLDLSFKKREIKRYLKFFLFPLIVEPFWFWFSGKIINFFNPESSYKFLVYYQWLGKSDNLFELAINIFTHPWQVFWHFFSAGNLLVLLVFLISFVFLPLLAKKYWILALGPVTQFALNSAGTGNIIYETHYVLLFFPALVISSIYGLKNLLKDDLEKFKKIKFILIKTILADKRFLILIVSVIIVYSNLVIGPTGEVFKELFFNYGKIKNQALTAKKIINQIPDNASIASSYAFLPNLSCRKKLYSLHYGFLGKTQFSLNDYQFPENPDYFLIDFSDFIVYHIQHNGKDNYFSGSTRLAEYLNGYGVVYISDSLVLFKKGEKGNLKLVEKLSEKKYTGFGDFQKPVRFGDKIILLKSVFAKEVDLSLDQKSATLDLFLFWQAQNSLKENYFLEFKILDSQQQIVWSKIYPLGYGIYPSSQWKKNEVIKTYYQFLFPMKFFNKKYKPEINLVNIQKGYLGLSGLRSSEPKIEKKEYLSDHGWQFSFTDFH